ncbi:nSTAND1 domain-containing NTPase [Streptomyces sp. TLI_55]|uniref:nSTAND1 domain-containing NTPase n=1 Tax=Streptomyces sp. TLI_55 TaxID=1938861 RepID=UPI000BE3AF6B|nr:PQQ-binding-like beta-propeller repeat protein [Streptomyces sp. TLI_55]
MAGRREVPVDPAAGPVQRFAFELRRLRAEAGGITYRALASRAGYSMTTLSQAAAGEQLPTLPVVLAYVRACAGDAARWEARWQQAMRECVDGAPEEDGAVAPYRGLTRFEPGDSHLFFGRDQLTADLVDLMRRRRVAALFGPSGSGKSSLLRAGLIPALRHPALPDPPPAAIRILTPGERPARTHAPLLTPADSPEADTFVIVDQFEEVFTLCHDPAERARFIDLLLSARRPERRMRVLLAVRGDFYGRCAEHRGLADALRDANLLVGAMTPAELRHAVVKPATHAGLKVERALTARLVKDVADAPGGLPLLSHALLETWRRRRGKTLTLAGYEAAGCLDGAIAQSAEQLYDGFTADQAAACRRILLRLIAPGDGTPDTRRPVDRGELRGTEAGDSTEVLEALAAARLLTLDGERVELAHEALITAWPRLRGWIEEARERLRVHRSLTEAAHAWLELDRDPGALYRGSRLALAREALGAAPHGELTDLERAFLDASRAHARKGRRRHRLVLGAVTTALCLALLAAGLAVRQWHNAVNAQQLAQSRQLAAQSRALLDTEPDLAALLAVHAYRTSPSREATAALYAAAALPLPQRLTAGTAPVQSLALSPDGRTLATQSTDGTVRIWKLPEGRLLRTLTGHRITSVAAFSPDGHTLATTAEGTTGQLVLWDAETGRKVAAFAVPDSPVRAVDFSADGRSLAAASRTGVRIWDVATGRTRHHFTGLPDLETAAFGPGGRTLVAVTVDGRTRVWDPTTGRTRTTGDHHVNPYAYTAVFSPDGRTYAHVGADGTLQLRDVASDKVRHTLDVRPATSSRVAFSPDGRTLAVPGIGDTVSLWDTVTGTLRSTVTAGRHGRGVMTVALGTDGRTLITSSNLDPTVRVHRLPADRPRTILTGTSLSDLAFSRDGRTLATVRPGPPGRGVVQLWNARTGHPRSALKLDTDPAPHGSGPPHVMPRPAAVTLGPTGQGLAARTLRASLRDQRIEVRDVATGRLRHSRVQGALDRAVFSPDGTRLALVGQDGSVRIWHLATGALRIARTDHDEPVRAVAFAPDSRTLAVVRITPTGEQITLHDAVTGRPRRTIDPGTTAPLTLTFGPDGHTLATASTGNGTVRTWDTRTGRLQGTFRVSAEVSSLAFSPDGRTLATGSARGVQLWDLATLQPRATLPARTPTALEFSPDGRTLAVADGSTAELWSIDLPDPDEAIRTICQAETGCPRKAE